MKTLRYLAIVLALIATSAIGQIPQNIESAFKSKYPKALLKKFKQENNGYVATFSNEEKKCKAVFNKKGNWLLTETSVQWKGVPIPVKVSFARSKYGNWLREDINQVETPDGNFYSVQVDSQYTLDGDDAYALAEDCCVYFTPAGSFVKEVKL